MPSDSIVFVDTNVFLYTFDARAEGKRQRAQAWTQWCWQRRAGRISTQVLHEIYANAVRKFSAALSTEKARSEVRRLRAWRPHAVDDDTVETAWSLQDRFALNYWDALMVAAARQQSCSHLLTEDLQHDQLIDGVRIVNPFLTGPEILDTAPP